MRNKRLLLISLPLIALCACEADPKSVNFNLAKYEAPLEIHQEHQKAYLEDSKYDNIGKYAAYAPVEEFTKPIAINLTWKVTSAKSYKVSVSENKDMSNSLTYETTKKSIDIYNLKVKTKYYWTVEATYKSNSFTSEPSEFETTNLDIRNVYVDGVDNVRDLGGYLTSSGKLVKQGLIYRSAELNKNKDMSGLNLITDLGLSTLKDELKIKTEVDLRKNEITDGVNEIGGISSSPIGSEVNYVNLPMYYDGENMLAHTDAAKDEINKNSIKSFFNLLKDKNNYPVMFHCVQGKDRTGMLSYILGALLGVSQDDLYRDYLFTNFSNSVGSPCKVNDIAVRYGLTISRCEGETLQEKTRNMLKTTFEFSDADLDQIVNNLL